MALDCIIKYSRKHGHKAFLDIRIRLSMWSGMKAFSLNFIKLGSSCFVVSLSVLLSPVLVSLDITPHAVYAAR